MEKGSERFEDTSVCWFQTHCEFGLFSMKFYLLDHICGDLEKLRIIYVKMALHKNILKII